MNTMVVVVVVETAWSQRKRDIHLLGLVSCVRAMQEQKQQQQDGGKALCIFLCALTGRPTGCEWALTAWWASIQVPCSEGSRPDRKDDGGIWICAHVIGPRQLLMALHLPSPAEPVAR